MGNRLTAALGALKARGEGGLVVYTTAGDPELGSTVDLVLAMAEAGVDAVELGMPFSDPVADGPTIQAASQRALEAGETPEGVFRCVEAVRKRSDVPVVVMTYANLVHRMGWSGFARRAADAGVDGVLVTDLPVLDAGEWDEVAASLGLATIYLVAPTSGPEALSAAGRRATGFVYCISRLGITGARSALPPDLPELIARVRAHADAPVYLGFGISTPDQVSAVVGHADGVVVGSAFIDHIRRAGAAARLTAAAEFCRGLKDATRSHG